MVRYKVNQLFPIQLEVEWSQNEILTICGNTNLFSNELLSITKQNINTVLSDMAQEFAFCYKYWQTL